MEMLGGCLKQIGIFLLIIAVLFLGVIAYIEYSNPKCDCDKTITYANE